MKAHRLLKVVAIPVFSILISLAPAEPPEPLAVETIEFHAESVDRDMKYNIILPEAYESTTERYPTLYLLHGLTSNYTAWARMGVPTYARELDMIVVMPDVGNSWYVNWAESDEGQSNSWEDFIVKDLVGHVDSNFRTLAQREGRAINGLSMGGYGGIVLGLRHPDMFCSIGSHSGALSFVNRVRERVEAGQLAGFSRREPSTQPDPRIGIESFNSQADRTPKGRMFLTTEDCDAYDPFKLVLAVPSEQMPHIYIDCGTEDRLVGSAQAFMKLLMENKIPFTYAQSEGGHRPAYWNREVGHSMTVQYHILERALGRTPVRPSFSR